MTTYEQIKGYVNHCGVCNACAGCDADLTFDERKKANFWEETTERDIIKQVQDAQIYLSTICDLKTTKYMIYAPAPASLRLLGMLEALRNETFIKHVASISGLKRQAVAGTDLALFLPCDLSKINIKPCTLSNNTDCAECNKGLTEEPNIYQIWHI